MSRRPPTKADVKRFRQLQEIGCIACRHDGKCGVASDIHHLLNGYRIGHQATIPLCPYHHRGIWEDEDDTGPTLSGQKREFVKRYGSEASLLEETNKLLAGMK